MPVFSEEVAWPEALSSQSVIAAVQQRASVELTIRVRGETAHISSRNVPDVQFKIVQDTLNAFGVVLSDQPS